MSSASSGSSMRLRVAPFMAGLLASLCVSWAAVATAIEPLHPMAVDEASVRLPDGWASIDRATFDAYAASLASGRIGRAAGGLNRAHYTLRLMPDDSLVGEASGTMRLSDEPAILSLGRPSFAVSNLELDGQQAVWGSDSAGSTCLLCPSDGAEIRFQCSQQGLRRGDSLEFSLDWLTSVATRVELKVPAGLQAETQGLLKTSTVNEPDGTVTLTCEAGARSNCTIRFLPRLKATAARFGMDLRQTLSATSTRVLVQSAVGILSSSAGPAVAEVEVPDGFTLLRAAIGGDERLPLEHPVGQAGLVRIPLGDLAVGQRVDLRLVMERPADWSQPLSVSRIVPRNGLLLREEVVLQFEKPLEIMHVEAPDYELVALAVEPAREAWTYRGTSGNGTLLVTARAPAAEWSAEYFVKRRQNGPRTEVLTLVDLKSIRSPLFEFDIDVLKPWKIVSVSAPDAVGNPASLTFRPLEESETAVRYRILLRAPATPQRGSLVTIAMATQSNTADSSLPRPVAVPRHGGGDAYLLLTRPDELATPPAELGPEIALNSLRPGLRSNAFFEPVRLGAATIHRGASSHAIDQFRQPPRPGARVNQPHEVVPQQLLKDALAVVELQTVVDSATRATTHRAQVVFDSAVDLSGASIGFDGEWSLIEVLGDGAPVSASPVGQDLRFPETSRTVRELVIRYSTPTAGESIPRRDRVPWPQVPSHVQRWNWRIETPTDRRVTAIDAPFEFVGGMRRPSVRERLLAPLSRPSGAPIFNPFNGDAWRELWEPTTLSQRFESNDSSLISVAGESYPGATTMVSWSERLLDGLNWSLMIGGMLAVAMLRRYRRGTFRFVAAVSAIAATSAWLLPPPFGAMAGATLCGFLIAGCLPRRLVTPWPGSVARSTGTPVPRFVGVTGVAIVCGLSSMVVAMAQVQSSRPNVLLPQNDGLPTSTAFVSEAVASDIGAWQRDRLGPSFLLRSARYDLAVDESEVASASVEFNLVIPRPDATRSVQIPFEGLTFRGPDAVQIDGQPAHFVPTADGAGLILSLPESPDAVPGEPASHVVQMQASLRVPAGGLKREFALMIPRCAAAVGAINSSAGPIRDLRSSARGRTQGDAGSVTCALGATGRWHARWRGTESPERSTLDSTVTARAESVVTAEPLTLLVQTRLIFETPELADPFASARLELELPQGSIVASVVGQTLAHWRTRTDGERLRLLLDFTSPPIVGQSVDFQFELPVQPAAEIEIPPIPLLPPPRLSNHQFAFVTSPDFQLQMISKPDPESGVWAIEPSEASFSLRKDRGLPIPGAALELDRPLPLAFMLSRRSTGRTAELEQSLVSAGSSVAWTGTARIETSVRPGFLYEFRIDPAIEITSASVVERDVERLSRFIREGDRLLLVVGDDRLGTKNVRLAGKLHLEAGTISPVPRFDLANTIISRREIVVTSSTDQLLQVRRSSAASPLVSSGDTEWEPQVPSSRRLALTGRESDFEMRWINPASPLKLVEFLTLPADGSAECSIEWQLESSQQLPATIAINAPASTRIDESSDFTEEGRRMLPDDRVRIELQSKSSRLPSARVLMTSPMQQSIDRSGALPRLIDLSVAPETYLAVPRSLVPSCDVPGDFLDELPANAPAMWAAPFTTRHLLVFALSGTDWRVSSSTEAEIVGQATAEIVTFDASEKIHGQTRLTISPSRVGILRFEPASGGALKAVRASTGALLEPAGDGVWELLLRPSQPVAVVSEWTAPPGQGGAPGLPPGPLTRGLELQVTYLARVPSGEATRWSPEVLERPAGAELLVAARLENLLSAAGRLPIGVTPPTWLREELLALGQLGRNSPRLGRLAAQVESLIDSWSARTSAVTAPNSVAPASLLLTRSPEQVLADGMLIAAADPDAVVELPTGHSAWSISRRLFQGTFVSAWFIVWAFVVTKGGEWVARRQWADRLASHPGVALMSIGLLWWLFFTPSVFGALLAFAAALWELLCWSRNRSAGSPAAS
ncbi:hypothetical protein Pan44_32580 [Caulifigura coniformis]|uniref:Uncharacterized protein n=1 Tax=Caulifigura coniformis TaxID=2527983 RepID=A0A517SGG0_9PLAN|nr:hypothetical protein [Caulifigura coniformis]QDT55216.1 hypothetical protein Pan44_32580 [Caulifigura coniformis]